MKLILKLYALYQTTKYKKWYVDHTKNQVQYQKQLFSFLLENAKQSIFGHEHGFKTIDSPDDLIRHIKINEYVVFKPYIDRIINGEKNVLWPGNPIYFARTSGTTGKPKLIPVTKESLFSQVYSYRLPFINYAKDYGLGFLDDSMLFLSADEPLVHINNFKTGRISAIADEKAPYLSKKNIITMRDIHGQQDNFAGFELVAAQIKKRQISVCIGMPHWFNEFIRYVLEKENVNRINLDNLSIFISSGSSYLPYEKSLRLLINSRESFKIREFYAASEGFIALQDTEDEAMLLLCDHIFYEFIGLEDYKLGRWQERVTLERIKLNTPYMILISTKAGLWSYPIGDIIEFKTNNPYRIIVIGREDKYLSIFEEKIWQKQLDRVILKINSTEQIIHNYFVAPNLTNSHLPFYEWFITCNKTSLDLKKLASKIDLALCACVPEYSKLRVNYQLEGCQIRLISENSYKKNIFNPESQNQQSKILHFQNHRQIADKLFKLSTN